MRPILLLHRLASSVHSLPRLGSPVGHLVGDRQVPCLLHRGKATGLARCRRWGRCHLSFQVFDPLMEVGVQTPVSCGICVASKSIVRLRLRLVENPKVCPRRPMVFIKLNGADVSLKSIHGLVLLLVKHSDGTPGVSVALRLVNRGAICNEGVMNLPDGSIASAMEVMRLSGLGLEVDRLLKKLDCLLDPRVLFPERLHTVVHPTHLPVDVSFQLGWQVWLIEENRILGFCFRVSPTHLVKMGYVEPEEDRLLSYMSRPRRNGCLPNLKWGKAAW